MQKKRLGELLVALTAIACTVAARPLAIPATTIDNTTAGPACAAAAWPVRTKMPVPMMAPMPSRVRSIGPSTRFNG